MKALLTVDRVQKIFPTPHGPLYAVDGVSFHVAKGETLGLVGESGCGKSTLGRLLIRLIEADGGRILFDDADLLSLNDAQMMDMRKRMQFVFQDPYSSLNPRFSVAALIAEPLIVHRVYRTQAEVMARVRALMDTVGLARKLEKSYPHELDGGRRQRIGIARALAMNPDFIVLDEPVSALDVCIQAQILNLLNQLKRDFGYTYIFISHNLSVVRHVSDRIAVMYLGRIVELSDYETIFANPLHPYTQALLSAIPIPEVGEKRQRSILEGEVPSPINPPPGCYFAPRCRYRQEFCSHEKPELFEVEPGHGIACHLHIPTRTSKHPDSIQA
jgi:peptide/nickel transport system ATP-binding protein